MRAAWFRNGLARRHLLGGVLALAAVAYIFGGGAGTVAGSAATPARSPTCMAGWTGYTPSPPCTPPVPLPQPPSQR